MSGLRRTSGLHEFHNGITASAKSSNLMKVSNYRHVTIAAGATGAADGTFKIMGGIGEKKFDITAAANAASNKWDYVEFYSYEDSTDRYDGDTGWVLAAAADFKNLTVNTDGLDWITVEVAGVTAGTYYASARGYQE